MRNNTYTCLRSPHCRGPMLDNFTDYMIDTAFILTFVVIASVTISAIFIGCVILMHKVFFPGSNQEEKKIKASSLASSTTTSNEAKSDGPSDSPTTTSIPPPLPLSIPTPPPLLASTHAHDHKHHLILCATGSVATIKIPLILHSLSQYHTTLSIRLILTPSSLSFLNTQSPEQPHPSTLLTTIPNLEAIYLDADEWLRPWKRGDPILHIELRRWADLMVVAPLSANSLAGMCGGFAGGLVGSVMRCWDVEGVIDSEREGVRWPYEVGGADDVDANTEGVNAEGRTTPTTRRRRKKGIIVAPAMNTAMWHHPVTREHISKLEGPWGVANGGWVEVLRPVEKELACGDTGSGAMREWSEIVGVVEERLGLMGRGRKEEGDHR